MFKCFIKNEISDEDYRKYKKFSYQVGDEEYTVLFKETDEIFTYDIECLKPEKYKGDILLRLTIDEQYIKDNLEYILRKMKDTDETKEKLQGETRLHIAIHQMYKIIAEIKRRDLKKELTIDEKKKVIKYGEYLMNFERVYWSYKNDLQELTGSRYVMVGVHPKELKGKFSSSHLKIAECSFLDFVTLYIDEIIKEMRIGASGGNLRNLED